MYIQPVSSLNKKITTIKNKIELALTKGMEQNNVTWIQYKVDYKFPRKEKEFHFVNSYDTVVAKIAYFWNPNILFFRIILFSQDHKLEIKLKLNKNFIWDFEFTEHFWKYVANKSEDTINIDALDAYPFITYVNEEYWIMGGIIKFNGDWIYIQDFSYWTINQPLTVIKWNLFVNSVLWNFLCWLDKGGNVFYGDIYSQFVHLTGGRDKKLFFYQSDGTIKLLTKNKSSYVVQSLDEFLKLNHTMSLFNWKIIYLGAIYDISKEDYEFIQQNLTTNNFHEKTYNTFSIWDVYFLCNEWMCFKQHYEKLFSKVWKIAANMSYIEQSKWFYALYKSGNGVWIEWEEFKNINNPTFHGLMKATNTNYQNIGTNPIFKEFYSLYTDDWVDGLFYQDGWFCDETTFLRLLYNEKTSLCSLDLVSMQDNGELKLELSLFKDVELQYQKINQSEKGKLFFHIKKVILEEKKLFYKFESVWFKDNLFLVKSPKYKIYPSHLTPLLERAAKYLVPWELASPNIFSANNRLYLFGEKVLCRDKFVDMKNGKQLLQEVEEYCLYKQPNFLWFRPDGEKSFYHLKLKDINPLTIVNVFNQTNKYIENKYHALVCYQPYLPYTLVSRWDSIGKRAEWPIMDFYIDSTTYYRLSKWTESFVINRNVLYNSLWKKLFNFPNLNIY